MRKMEEIVGVFAMIVSVTVVLTGFPHQVYKNYQRKSVQGVSLPLISGAFVAYSAWLVYGLFRADVFLIVSQSFGSLACVFLLFQFFIYRKGIEK